MIALKSGANVYPQLHFFKKIFGDLYVIFLDDYTKNIKLFHRQIRETRLNA